MIKKKAIFFYLTLFLLIFAVSFANKFYDHDLWARLIAGMGFVQSGAVLKADFLSYTPTHEWIDHEWGSGVVFYIVRQFFGGTGLIVLQALLISLMFFIISRAVKLKSETPYNIFFYFIAFSIISTNLIVPIRCQLFSFLFFALSIYLLEKVRAGNKKLLWWLPAITLLWANLHGGVVSGLGLIAIYIVGEFWNKKEIKWYTTTLFGCFLVVFINPWGAKYLRFLFEANTMSRTYITEWRSPFHSFFKTTYLPFAAFMVGIFALEAFRVLKDFAAKWKSVDKTKLILLVLTSVLAIKHVKMLPFFVISATIFCYSDFYKFMERFSLPKHKDKFIYTVLILYSFAQIILGISTLTPLVKNYPVKSIEFIRINNLNGKLLTNFGHGSYAAYKLFPHNLIYMDGRYEEVYDDELVELQRSFFTMAKDFDKLLKKYPPDVMILEKRYLIYDNIKGWQNIYQDGNYRVFVPSETAKKSYKLPSNDTEYYEKTMFDTEITFRKGAYGK